MKTRLEMVKELFYRRSPLDAAFLLEVKEQYFRVPSQGTYKDPKTGEEHKVFWPTAAVDGTNLMMNLEFLESLTLSEGDTAFCHEMRHILFKHPWRRPKHLKWMVNAGMEECHLCCNIAEDMIINDSLLDEKKDPLPGWMHQADARNKTVVELLPGVYAKEHSKHQKQQGGCTCPKTDDKGQPQDGQGDGDGQPDPNAKKGKGAGKQGKQGCPEHGGCCKGAPDDLSEAEIKEIEKKIDETLIQAAKIAKKRGNIPAWAERYVQEVTTPKLNWIEETRMWLDSKVPTDFSWTRPAKQKLAFGAYTPRFCVESVGAIAIFVDTSGSIGETELALFAGEMRGIFQQLKPLELHVLYIDAAVAGYDYFSRADELVIKPRGGGGTSFRPGFEYLKKEGIEVRGVIYLTDLYGDWKEMDDPGVETLFVSQTTPEQAEGMMGSWGRYVHMRPDVK